MIGNETDLHYKVVDLIRRYYPDSILVAGLGENQDTEDKRLDSYKKGYMRGQPDLMVLNYHKDYKGASNSNHQPIIIMYQKHKRRLRRSTLIVAMLLCSVMIMIRLVKIFMSI